MARNEVVIDAPPERVFEILSDPLTYADWVPGTRSVRDVDENWPEEGSAFRYVAGPPVIGVSDETRVLRSLPPVRLELQILARPLASVRAVLELAPEDRGTRVTMIEEPAHPVLRLLIGPLGHGLLRLRNVEALRRLKRLAEEPSG